MLELAQLLMSIAGIGLPFGIFLLMSGRVKIRNELDTIIRAVAAIAIYTVCYWSFGYGILSAPTYNGLFGVGGAFLDHTDMINGADNLRIFFLFSVPAIIVTTSMVERGSFAGASLLAAIVSLLVVPVVAHWAWADSASGRGWLAARGFIDHGGATVIFICTAFAGLAASAAIGPRTGRFPLQSDRPRGQSPTFHALGIMSMVISLAITAASQADQIVAMPGVIFKTMLGASFAVISALILLIARRKKGSAMDLMTAALAGAIALTAFAAQSDPASAALTGLFAGAGAMGVRRMLASAELDDPGDLISSFLAGGLVGGLLAPLLWSGSNLFLISQLVTQIIGFSAVAVWSFGVIFFLAKLMSFAFPLRVSQVDEQRGLSRTHFGLQSELDFLVSHLQRRLGQEYGNPGDEKAELSKLSSAFSEHIVRLRTETHRATDRIQSMSTDVKKATAMAAHIRLAEDTLRVKSEDILLLLEDLLTGSSNKLNGSQFQSWMSDALQIALDPTLRDLKQFARHLPLQAELDELENIIVAAADTVSRSARHLELLHDLSDAQVEGFFSRDHTCDLAQLLTQNTRLLNTLAEVHSNPVQIDCPVQAGLTVAGDVNAFTRLLKLMVEGAFNRTHGATGKPVRLELREQAFGQYVVFECLDTGTALTGRQIRAILNPMQEDSSLEDLGLLQILPLMLVARLVEAIGGELTLSSEQGLGTRLHCRFRKQTASANKGEREAA